MRFRQCWLDSAEAVVVQRGCAKYLKANNAIAPEKVRIIENSSDAVAAKGRSSAMRVMHGSIGSDVMPTRHWNGTTRCVVSVLVIAN